MALDAAPSTVAAVNLKLPLFWPADPEVWFAQVEAQFATRSITVQKTKFDYTVALLSPEYATEVFDLLLHPPDARPYDVLQRRLQQLLTSEELGDRKPSHLLRRMEQLLGDETAATDSAFVRELFLQRLPGNVRMVLASSPDDTTLEDLAQLADRMVEVSAPPVASFTTDSSPGLDQLRAEVSRLADLVTSISARDRPSPRRRSPTPRRSPSPARRSVFWYHERFGTSARKCRPPCSPSGNDPAGR